MGKGKNLKKKKPSKSKRRKFEDTKYGRKIRGKNRSHPDNWQV